ncbi:MAG: hypothetical protein WD960_15180 [Gemmatimonadota bacterium]
MAGFPHRQPERYLRAMLPESSRICVFCTLLLTVLQGGCSEGREIEPLPESESASAPTELTSDGAERIHERSLVFLSQDGDSSLVLPLSFRTFVRGTTTTREAGAWLGLEGEWELMALDSAAGETLAVPFRTLPTRRIRIVVGDEGALEALLVRDSLHRVDVRAGINLQSWVGTTGEALTLRRASTGLPEEESAGFLLDLNLQDPASRDWIFLEGGDGFQAVLVQDRDDGAAASYQGWGRVAVRDVRWSELTVEWDEVLAFERARRDIPVRWALATPEGDLSGTLESIGAHLTALEGEGPLLPLSAWFHVRGELDVAGEAFEVTGVIRHRQR